MAIGGAAIGFFWAGNFFGNQFCEINWFYILLEPCLVQQISENGQKVKIETLLNFDENSFFLARADFLDLEFLSLKNHLS